MIAQKLIRQSLVRTRAFQQCYIALNKDSIDPRRPLKGRLHKNTFCCLPQDPFPEQNYSLHDNQDHGESEIEQSGIRQKTVLQPGLYLVATPIGNLEDITLRALRVLRNASAILAEDTRHSQKLLKFYGIETRTFSFHGHNEREKEGKVLEMLQAGDSVALISDAGMPLISDPGSSLIRTAAQKGIRIIPIPGPSAVMSALVASGLSTTAFQFCGFLPPKQMGRQRAVLALKDVPASLVFFVPPHALNAVLTDLAVILGGYRRCAVARELTKVYEEFFRGSLDAAMIEFSQRTIKGEITLVVEGLRKESANAISDEQIELKLHAMLESGLSASAAAKKLSQDLDLPKNRVYSLAIQKSALSPAPGLDEHRIAASEVSNQD